METGRYITQACLDAGACGVGIIPVTTAEDCQERLYDHALTSGHNGSMAWMARNRHIRHNPALLLEGARTMICCAFDYTRPRHHAHIADYALGATDYHIALRHHLSSVTSGLEARFGGETRILVDSAPLYERYWAAKAGLGYIGINNCLYVPGVGSTVFLAEILWTGLAAPATAFLSSAPKPVCNGCNRCVRACPAGALSPSGECDFSKCLSYLTVEYRGEDTTSWPRGATMAVGCDICQRVCPLNAHAATPSHPILPELAPSPRLMALSLNDMAAMSDSHFRTIFANTSISRLKPHMLRRNASFLLANSDNND